MDTEQKMTYKDEEIGLWDRLPKSTVINFGALCFLFLAIFLLHHFSDSIINDDKSADTSDSPKVEVEKTIEVKKPIKAKPERVVSVEHKEEVVAEEKSDNTEVEKMSPKVVTLKTEEATPKDIQEAAPKVVSAKEILKDESPDTVKEDKPLWVATPKTVEMPTQEKDKSIEKKIDKPTLAEKDEPVKKKTIVKRTRRIPRAIEVGATVEDLDGESARQGYLAQTVKYIQRPKSTTTRTRPTVQYRSPPIQPTYSEQNVYIPFEKRDR